MEFWPFFVLRLGCLCLDLISIEIYLSVLVFGIIIINMLLIIYLTY